MKKRKRYADGGNVATGTFPVNPIASPSNFSGLGAIGNQGQAQMAPQAQQRMGPGPQATSLYPGPAGTFPNAIFKKGGAVKSFKKGGSVKSSASSRADGIATKGKTRGKYL